MKEGDKNIVVKIKATNLELTPALESYVDKKIRLLEKYTQHYSKKSGELIFEIEIGKTTLHHKQGNIFRAEINFTAGRVHLRSESKKEDLYAAIDEAKDDLERRLRRGKNKYSDFMKRGGAAFKKLLR